MFERSANQIFVEGENNKIYFYMHMMKLCPKSASKILDEYADEYREYMFDKLIILFWDVNIPGEHLSVYRKTQDEAIGKILKGFQFIESCYDYLSNEKVIHKPRFIN